MAQGISEFSLIDRYFKRLPNYQSINLGIGDDCALLKVPQGFELAITTDTMVENIHFFADCEPGALGHKALAVNLSDLAAMGAKPMAVTLAITLPTLDDIWLSAFAKGFFDLAGRYHVDLIGGDTTQGPLTITITAFGVIPNGQALLRSGAKLGDIICMTGSLGDAGLGLKIQQGYRCLQPSRPLEAFHKPEPQLQIGQDLLGIASSCIDISDGLASDLGHILAQSQAGANLFWEKLPISTEVNDYIADTKDWAMPLLAGDDYQLCFTVSPDKIGRLVQIPHSQIGVIEAEPGLRLTKSGSTETFLGKGYEHFS